MKKGARRFALCSMLIVMVWALVFPQVGADKRPTPAPKASPPKTQPKRTVPKRTAPRASNSRPNNPKPKAEALTAQVLADRASNYLVNERGIDASRIVRVDGGYREDFAVELWIVPQGAMPPTASPTRQPPAGMQHAVRDLRNINAPASASTLLRDWQQPCPRISVICPDRTQEGTPVTFSAYVFDGDPRVSPTYNWTVSAGTITSGQGTSSITVDSAGIGGGAITATVQVGGYNINCTSTASCSTSVFAPLVSKLFDRYGNIPLNDEKRRLDNFAVQLMNDPVAQAYIMAYGRSSRVP